MALRKAAVERLKNCDNIVALSEELSVYRRLLCKWRDQLEPIEDGDGPPANLRERDLRQQVTYLKRVADKTPEADFFKGALQKIEARRLSRSNSGKWHLRADARSDANARQPGQIRNEYRTNWHYEYANAFLDAIDRKHKEVAGLQSGDDSMVQIWSTNC